MSPAEALEQARAGHMVMMTPTVAVLARLARYSSVSEAIAAADSDALPQRMRLRQGSHDIDRILFPGDPDYESGAESEFGQIRI